MKTRKLVLLAVAILMTACNYQDIEVNKLRVEMNESPLGVNVDNPRFSWQIVSTKHDLMQTSYHIQVAQSPHELEAEENLVWDSGVVTSDASIHIPYAGEKLQSGKDYYWRIRITTTQGNSEWSNVERWSMALDNDDWQAVWIGEDTLANQGETDNGHTQLAARYLRKQFTYDKDVKRAMLYISGLGSYEAYIDGNRVSEDIFAPVPTLYTKRVYYNTYDVTKMLSGTTHTLGVILGNGRYFGPRNPGMATFGLPRLLAQLEIEFSDGSKEIIKSDSTWKITSHGPIAANNEFDGEEYDARLELDGWNKNGYDDNLWKKADIMDAPGGSLVAQQTPNIRIHDEVKPISIIALDNGKYLLDMGQNMVGWLAVDLKAKAGQTISFVFAEVLNNDSTLNMANLRSAKVTDKYTANKDGLFHWEPSFVYHGFRYVEISGLDYKPSLDSFTGKVLYDKMETTGSVETSHALVNQIHQNAFWGIRGNYRGMPTDCPQRDERLGWLGDRTTGAYGEAYIFDNSLLYNKWIQDIEDSMTPEGSISDVSPNYWAIYNDDVTWPAAFFSVADMLYKHYGDNRAIIRHYDAMKKWMKYIESVSMVDYIMTKDTYGDWCMPPERQELIHSQDPSRITEGAILSTTVYYDLLHKMAMFAAISGHNEDIEGYIALAKKMKDAYNKKYFNYETAQYGNNTVTANILSLRLGLVPEGYESSVFENIVKKTNDDFGGNVSVGVLGIQHIMRGLTENGRLDMAYKLLTNEEYPSWGYTIKKGATTIWELWNGDTADPAMNSANHVMLLGDLIIWYYEHLSGIKCDPESVAFKNILMQPVFPEGIDYVKASYKSVYGEIKSTWKIQDDKFAWDVTIPCNTTATLRIPAKYEIEIEPTQGIHEVSKDENYTQIVVGSGTYHFAQ